MGSGEGNEAVVRRFYEELWNGWRLDVADEIVAATVLFRGSFGKTAHGRDAFKAYVEAVHEAFPDWRNHIEEMVTAGDRVAVRLRWTGTHRGPLDGFEPTGRPVEYCGAAFFRLGSGLIESAWAVGDTELFWRMIRP